MSEDQFGQVTVAGLPAGRGCIWSLAQVVSSPKFNVPLLKFDLDLWCFRGRVFGFPACLSGHSGSVRTFARTKGQDGRVPFLGVLGAFRQSPLKGDRQYVPAFSKHSPSAIAWQRNPALVRDRTIVGAAPHLPRSDDMADRLSSLWIARQNRGNRHLFRRHG